MTVELEKYPQFKLTEDQLNTIYTNIPRAELRPELEVRAELIERIYETRVPWYYSQYGKAVQVSKNHDSNDLFEYALFNKLDINITAAPPEDLDLPTDERIYPFHGLNSRDYLEWGRPNIGFFFIKIPAAYEPVKQFGEWTREAMQLESWMFWQSWHKLTKFLRNTEAVMDQFGNMILIFGYYTDNKTKLKSATYSNGIQLLAEGESVRVVSSVGKYLIYVMDAQERIEYLEEIDSSEQIDVNTGKRITVKVPRVRDNRSEFQVLKNMLATSTELEDTLKEKRLPKPDLDMVNLYECCLKIYSYVDAEIEYPMWVLNDYSYSFESIKLAEKLERDYYQLTHRKAPASKIKDAISIFKMTTVEYGQRLVRPPFKQDLILDSKNRLAVEAITRAINKAKQEGIQEGITLTLKELTKFLGRPGDERRIRSLLDTEAAAITALTGVNYEVDRENHKVGSRIRILPANNYTIE